MALPFVLGLAVGAGVVCAYNNKRVKEKTFEVLEKSKDFVCDIKNNVDATIDCIKEKFDKKVQTVTKDLET